MVSVAVRHFGAITRSHSFDLRLASILTSLTAITQPSFLQNRLRVGFALRCAVLQIRTLLPSFLKDILHALFGCSPAVLRPCFSSSATLRGDPFQRAACSSIHDLSGINIPDSWRLERLVRIFARILHLPAILYGLMPPNSLFHWRFGAS